MFADMHCHAHMRTYLYLCQKKIKNGAKEISPWTIIATNMYRLKHADRAAGFGQADLVSLWNSGTRLVFVSMYPIEREFFLTPEQPVGGKYKFLRKVVRLATHHKAPIRTLLQHLIMRLPIETINYVISEKYDYWEFLQKEYAFLKSKSGIVTKNEIHSPGLLRTVLENNENRRVKYPDHYHAEGCYQIPMNRAEALEISKKNIILMPLTIEGGHVFDACANDEKTVLGRIDHIKNKWQHPLFFITISHHFDNKLCGHAHSLPSVAEFLLNQRKAMNTGITGLGWKVIRKLLAVDEHNNPVVDENYRVLIDLKHMSAQARKEYYEQLIRPCMAKGDSIPLIASHCSYSGRKTLQEMIDLQDSEDDTFRVKNEYGTYYAWNINLCDEDILMIYKTGGIFGLSFDKRMTGISSKKKEEKMEHYDNINGLWNNLKAALQVIYTDDSFSLKEKRKAWDMLAIGTDFDGYIEPVSTYKTALKLPDFKQDLLAAIKRETRQDNPLQCVSDFDEVFTPELVVDKICYDNALNFTLKHYPEKSL
ncbi:MAG: dipeptidase [Saprospiraceae bacterium]|nr:dipeptidase [Saprospiraceae bacterium]